MAAVELRGNAGGAPFGSGAASLSRVSTLLSGSTTLEEISPPPALTSPGYAPLPKRHDFLSIPVFLLLVGMIILALSLRDLPRGAEPAGREHAT